MKLYLIAGLLAVLVVSGLSTDATQGHEIRAILKLANRVSREHGIPALLKLPNDVSGEAKRGSGDILHHLYCLEFHKAGYCKYALIKNKYCKKTCFLCNIEALGMQSRAIPNARITASSMWDGNHAPSQGRLYYKPPGGKAGSWSSRHNRVGQWIKVDLNRVTKVHQTAAPGMARPHVSEDGAVWMQIRRRRTYELHNKMKLYLIAGLLAVLVVSGLSMDATQGHEIRAILKLANRVSREHGIPALLKLPNDVSGEAKRGSGDILHHLYCLEFHKAGYCKYALIKNKYCKKTCFLCNIEPLGMQSRAIPNARITASSMWDGNHAPSQGRLYYKPPGGKAGIATQGRTNANQWVTKYKLQYSLDGKSFNNYEGGKVFAANRDRNSVVKHDIQTPIIARSLTSKSVRRSK
ncbi:hypothetical protein QZH41_006599 [Actinostola sp. cb2023]|nr:hypothetical protein QZH41_006599 [Actinostola sp. cb2023]